MRASSQVAWERAGIWAGMGWWNWVWVLVPQALIFTPSLLNGQLRQGVLSPLLIIGVVGAASIGMMIWRNRRALNAPPRLVTAALLEERLCAQCGYSLRELSAEPDGCRACPECGAAWRLDEPPAAKAL